MMYRRQESDPLPLVDESSPAFRRGSLPTVFCSPGRDSLRWSPSKSSHSSPFRARSRTTSDSMGWAIKIVYVGAGFSWIALQILSPDSNFEAIVADVEYQAYVANAHMDHMQDDLNKIDAYISSERKTLSKLKKSRGALEHELRMVKEIESVSGKQMKTAANKNKNLIQSWLDHRKDGLVDKIHFLQRYLQASSRMTVLRK
jgi:hypothetical protein